MRGLLCKVYEWNNFATKIKAASVARSVASLGRGRFVADTGNASSAGENGRPREGLKGSEHRSTNGERSSAHSCATVLAHESPRPSISNDTLFIACSTTYVRS